MCSCKSSTFELVTTTALLLLVVCSSTTPAWADLQFHRNYHPMRHFPLQRAPNNVYRAGGFKVRESGAQNQPPVQPPTDIEKFNEYQRQIQQWQIAVVVPPGGAPPPAGGVPVQGGQSPPPAPPGSVWIQVPAGGSYYPSGPSAPPSGAGYPPPSYPNPPPDASFPSNPSFPPPDNSFPPPDNSFPPPDNSFPPPDNSFPPPDNSFPSPDNSFPPPDSSFPPPNEPAPAPVPEHPVYPPYPPAVSEPSNELPPAGSESPSTSDSGLKALCKAPRGQFPGTSCGKFVNCWDDFVVEQDCPSGLYFNPGGFCDYPFNVDCKEGEPPKDPSSGGSPGTAVGPGYPGEGYPPPGSLPPPSEGAPSPPATGSYPPPPSPVGSYPPPPSPVGSYPPPPSPGSDPESTALCPSAYGTFRSKTNCGKFYTCVAGKPYEFICPAGLNFHEDLKVCDYPYRVECNGVPTNPVPPEEPETSPEQPQSPETANPPNALIESPAGPPPAGAPAPDTENPAFFGLKKYYNYAPLVNPQANLGRYQCLGRNNYVYRLSPTCSSVAVCQDGHPQVIHCRQGQSYDMRSRRCLATHQARC